MTTSISTSQPTRAQSALRAATTLIGAYLGLSVVTLIAVIILRDIRALVTVSVWIRIILVVASAVWLFLSARRASAGAPRAYLRVRVISAIVFIAIVVIIALPGTFPFWVKIEQAVSGLVLLAAVILVNTRSVRASFATK